MSSLVFDAMSNTQNDSKCSGTLLRCQTSVGSLMHIWWSCTKVKEFWRLICNEINVKVKIPLSFSLELCLLHLDLDKTNLLLLSNMLIAAKLLLAAQR